MKSAKIKIGWSVIAGGGIVLAVILSFPLSNRSEGPDEPRGRGPGEQPSRNAASRVVPCLKPELDLRYLESLLFERPAKVRNLLAEAGGDRNTLVNSLGRLLRREIESSGDYEKIRKILDQLDEKSARELIVTWVIGSASPRGALEDFKAQRAMVGSLAKGKDTRALSLFYSTLSPAQVAQVLKTGRMLNLSAPEERELIRASILASGVAKSFAYLEEASKSDRSEDQQLLQFGMEQALTNDPHGTAALVSQMSDGPSKDKFSKALIAWLCKVGDTDSARKWSEDLPRTDSNLKFIESLKLNR